MLFNDFVPESYSFFFWHRKSNKVSTQQPRSMHGLYDKKDYRPKHQCLGKREGFH